MEIEHSLDIVGIVDNQIRLCFEIVDSLSEDEFIFSLSMSNQENKGKMKKYLIKPKIWENLIPGYFHTFNVKKESLNTFKNLLSPTTNSIFVFVGNDDIYRSFDVDDVCIFPRTQKELNNFSLILNNLKKENIINDFDLTLI